MIKLTAPINYKGGIIDAGAVLNLDPQVEKNMIKAGTAEKHDPTKEKSEGDGSEMTSLEKMTKAQLLEYANSLNIPDVSDELNKNEIIAKIQEVGK